MSTFRKRIFFLYDRATAEAGLTLIEVLASMMIFMVVASGVAGTLTAGLSSTARAQIATKGKAAAEAQIEEMRARPFFVPYSADPGLGTQADIDLLDRYYPDVGTSHVYDGRGWDGWYTIAGGDAYYTKVSPDDNGITRKVISRFVDNEGNIIVPPESYNHDASTLDTPPSYLLKVTVITTWTDRGGQASYTLDSFISATTQSDINGDGVETTLANESDSYADITGLGLDTSLIVNNEALPLLDVTLGDVHATAKWATVRRDYEPSAHAWANSYNIDLVSAGIFPGYSASGASVSVFAPPDDEEVVTGDPDRHASVADPLPSPLTLSLDITGSSAHGTARTGPIGGEESYSLAGASALNLQLMLLGSNLVTTTNSVGDQVQSEVTQYDGATDVDGNIHYGQVSIMPTAEAPQGLVFVRSFNAASHSEADPDAGTASNALDYSAIIGVYHPGMVDLDPDCPGDPNYACFVDSPQNAQSLQLIPSTSVGLEGLLTADVSIGLTSASSESIASAMNARPDDPDGAKATIAMDGLIRLDVHVNVKQLGITLAEIDQNVRLGSFNVQVLQK